MSRKSDNSPVQTQMAVTAFNGTRFGGEYHVKKKSEEIPVGRRRVFVQTETGCVFGMDLDRGDNAHTVKRRLQVALNIPSDESSLTFGDMVLNNDLSLVRNDSSLLLTRKTLHRSSSTPCLSPSGKNLGTHRDKGGPIEILGRMIRCPITTQIVEEIVDAIKNGVEPIPVHGGLGGAYYFRNSNRECVAIVKPTDEEPFAPNNPKGFVGKALGQPGLKRSVRVGETGFREVAAYLLDHGRFANVPATFLAKITHLVFNVNDGVNGDSVKNKKKVSKIASIQQFISHDFDASDYGTSSFPVTAVHRIGILDIRIFNTDRHGGNLLVRKLDGVGRFGQVELIPIDHGLCLPESLEDPYFEWIHWPQASIPFSEDELVYMKNLNPIEDSKMLRSELPMIREACLRVFELSTIFLKEAAAFGLCLAEIGEMMSREFRGTEEEPSELELMCLEARRIIVEKRDNDTILSESDVGDEELLFDIDSENPEVGLSPRNQTGYHYGFKGVNSRNPLSILEEGIEEEEDEEPDSAENIEKQPNWDRFTSVPKLSMSLKNISFTTKKSEVVFASGMTSGSRSSANEQLPTSTSFVKLADMDDGDWVLFLEKFQELLYPAFVARKSVRVSQKLRLGTSCQF